MMRAAGASRETRNRNPSPQGDTRALLAGLALAGWLLGSPSAWAQECVWGQPGYRSCVDGLLAKRKQDEEKRGPSAATGTFKTAPARNRPPALTPLSDADRPPQPTAVMPKAPDRDIYDRRFTNDAFARMRRDAERPAIMPQNRDLFQMPGRICPSQGC
jgi:hypothetical protein